MLYLVKINPSYSQIDMWCAMYHSVHMLDIIESVETFHLLAVIGTYTEQMLLFRGVIETMRYVLTVDMATGTDSRQSSVKKSVQDVAAYGE